MWLPEGRLASCAVFVYITRRNVIVYVPHHSAPCSVPQRLTCMAASAVSLTLWHLCSAMGSAGKTSERGREGRLHFYSPGALPVLSLQAGRPQLCQGGLLHVTLTFWALVCSIGVSRPPHLIALFFLWGFSASCLPFANNPFIKLSSNYPV